MVQRVHTLRAEYGRAAEPFEVHAISLDAFSIDGVRRLEDLGVTDAIVGFRYPYTTEPDTQPLQEKIDLLRRFADSVVSQSEREFHRCEPAAVGSRAMKFAMFYEIPVAKPWTPQKEYEAYKNTIEQVKLGDRMGFHSFWTVEHHFLDEYSHCSNPEVLYGHIAGGHRRTCASATASACCPSRTTTRSARPRASRCSTS